MNSQRHGARTVNRLASTAHRVQDKGLDRERYKTYCSGLEPMFMKR